MRLQALAQVKQFAHSARLDMAAIDPSPLLASVQHAEDRRFLKSDIEELASQLGELLGCRHLRAYLYTQRTDGCRKIHTDNVTLRLICTYAGPGTDWLRNEDVVREKLVPSELDAEIANRQVVKDGAVLQRSASGEVLLLKGDAYPGNSGFGAAHRSPPLEATAATRLVLKIDRDRCGC